MATPSRTEVHVIPPEDTREHVESEECHCYPRKWINKHGIPAFSHNAYDLREARERNGHGMGLGWEVVILEISP